MPDLVPIYFKTQCAPGSFGWEVGKLLGFGLNSGKLLLFVFNGLNIIFKKCFRNWVGSLEARPPTKFQIGHRIEKGNCMLSLFLNGLCNAQMVLSCALAN